MRLSDSTHLTYCLNIHPGEAWADQQAAIEQEAAAVKAAICPGRPFGLGLRIGRRALDDLAAPGAVDTLRRVLDRLGCYVFTVNAFPYGPFHGQPVKTGVYLPDWAQRERLDYTLGVADVLAALLPEGVDGSISTLPLAYGEPLLSADQIVQICERLADAALALHAIEARTGRLLHLGLEPEPDCLLETTSGCIAFFERSLLPLGVAWLCRQQGLTMPQAERILYRHIGICFDTCHLAVQFESLSDSLRLLQRHSIRLSKVQLSAALETRSSQAAVYALFPFAQDTVYLHQAKLLQADGTLISWADLTPERLTSWNVRTPARPCRIHYHVPLDFAGGDNLASTAALLTPEFYRTAQLCGAPHFEIETYTFAVLPPAWRERSLVANLIAEYRQVLAAWPQAQATA